MCYLSKSTNLTVKYSILGTKSKMIISQDIVYYIIKFLLLIY